MNYTEIIDKFYPAGSAVRDIYLRHCNSVAQEALAIKKRCQLSLPDDVVTTAAMLHDIGIVRCHAPSIHCEGIQPYIAHGIVGAQMLRDCGVDEVYCAVAERHTGAGLTPDDIVSQKLPLPVGDYCPHTLLERLICYADKFYSKGGDMKRKPLAKVRASMSAFGADSLARFELLVKEFEVSE